MKKDTFYALLAATAFAFFIVLLGYVDYQDQILNHRLYCHGVEQGRWPDDKGDCDE